MTLLPPGVSARDFAAALGEFRAIVGAEWVFTSEEDVGLYRDAYSPLWGEPRERVASAAVAPDRVEQVQAVVRIANRYRIALYPISTGRNLTYGGSAPNVSGSVVVDLRRMNRVLAVDDKRCFALVEPGVSYFDLYRHIQDHKMKVWIDCPDPGWGSPMGNALDRGLGYTLGTYRDHFGAHCGMEVVTPTGELMRTGMGAMPGAQTWQEFRYGYGPQVDGLFAQGNFGIVTKMGFWLMPEPEAYLVGLVSAPRRADLGPMIDVMSKLEFMGVSGNGWFGSPLGDLRFTDPDLKALLAKGWPSEDALDQMAERKGAMAWNLTVPLYGSIEGVQGNWTYAQRLFAAAVPGARFEVQKFYTLPLTPEQMEKEHKVEFGIPSLAIFGGRSERRPNPSDGHLDFSCIIPRSGEAVFEFQRVMADVAAKYDIQGRFGPIIDPFQTASGPHYRAYLMILFLPTSRTDPEMNRRTRASYARLVETAAAHGWGEYRASPHFQDLVASTYGFNDHALRRFRETLKDAVDPNGVLSPGRGGVWPKRLRSLRNEKPQ